MLEACPSEFEVHAVEAKPIRPSSVSSTWARVAYRDSRVVALARAPATRASEALRCADREDMSERGDDTSFPPIPAAISADRRAGVRVGHS